MGRDSRSRSRSRDRRRRSRSRDRSRDRRRRSRSRSRERRRRHRSRSRERRRDRSRSRSRERSRRDEQPPSARPTEGSEAVAPAAAPPSAGASGQTEEDKKAARLAKLQAWRQQQGVAPAPVPLPAVAASIPPPQCVAPPPQPPLPQQQEGLLNEEGDEIDPLDAFMAAEVRCAAAWAAYRMNSCSFVTLLAAQHCAHGSSLIMAVLHVTMRRACCIAECGSARLETARWQASVVSPWPEGRCCLR